MKASIIISVLAAALMLAVTATAAAHPNKSHEWWAHPNGAGGLACSRSEDGVYGPFQSRDQCEDFVEGLPGDGGGGGGGGNGGESCGVTLTSSDGNVVLGGNPAACLPAPPHGNGAFLCYSVGGQPMPVDVTIDAGLQALGYWLPTDYPGAVAGGTNLTDGSHLACDAPIPGVTVEAFKNEGQKYTDNHGPGIDVLDFDSASSTGFVGVYLVAA